MIADLGRVATQLDRRASRRQGSAFASFDLQIADDKVERWVELSATVAEVVADAFENAKALQAEGSS